LIFFFLFAAEKKNFGVVVLFSSFLFVISSFTSVLLFACVQELFPLPMMK